MWAGNQASRLIGRKTDKLWGRKREVVPCMIMYSFIPLPDNVHSMLGLIHSSQSTGGLFTLFVKKPLCFLKPVKVCWLDCWGGECFWMCGCVWSSVHVLEHGLCFVDVCAVALGCAETDISAMRTILVREWFGLIGRCSCCILNCWVFWSALILN